eukprot:scaffold36275_cov154-Isochrysis_galbana.AAC.35
MPAVAKVMPTPGRSTSITPTQRALTHSLSWRARSAAWLAESADEHAVSYETHGPCSPSTNGRRPAAIEWLLPVAAYTLRDIGDDLMMSVQSLAAIPTNIPVTLPRSSDRGMPHDALLWVHRGCFRRRDAEALIVEELQAPQEGSVASALQDNLIVHDCRVHDPPIRRDFRDNVATAGCERAKPSGGGLAARKSTAQTLIVDLAANSAPGDAATPPSAGEAVSLK